MIKEIYYTLLFIMFVSCYSTSAIDDNIITTYKFDKSVYKQYEQLFLDDYPYPINMASMEDEYFDSNKTKYSDNHERYTPFYYRIYNEIETLISHHERIILNLRLDFEEREQELYFLKNKKINGLSQKEILRNIISDTYYEISEMSLELRSEKKLENFSENIFNIHKIFEKINFFIDSVFDNDLSKDWWNKLISKYKKCNEILNISNNILVEQINSLSINKITSEFPSIFSNITYFYMI